MVQGRNFVTALMVGTASISMIVAGTTVPAAAQAATGNYRIESQPLGQALMQLSRQANVDIVAPAKIVRGRVSKAVAAESVDGALQQMLSGTGLKFKRAGSRYVIQSGNVQGGGSAPGSTTAPAPERVPASQRQGRGTITGTVRDQVSGASLKGALVELVGTGRSTSTDDLGEFRFVNAPEGNVTVRISYLGYAEQQSTIAVGAGEAYAEEFTLVGGSGGQEIVVYGSRSARAQALNQERTAENMSTVISGDLLGDFNGTTLSESLRRAPGVTFERNAETGDGTNIAIRGLAPDLNTVKFNGIELPEASGTGRSASLGNILTESISKVTISKTLLPSQDSSGTGGLVEIETKTPLDRPRRFFSATLEGAQRGKNFNDEFLAAGTASIRFGRDDKFGVSASVQYRKRDIKRVGYGADFIFGHFFPLQVDGTPTVTSDLQIDPRTPFPYEPEADGVYPSFYRLNRDQTRTSNLGITLSAAAELGEHTKLFADYQRLRQEDETSIQTWGFNPANSFELTPIVALSGEQRIAMRWNQSADIQMLSSYRPNDVKTTDIYTLRGQTELGNFSFRYSGGYTKGTSVSDSYRISGTSFSGIGQYILPEVLDSVEGRIISPFAPRTPGDDSFFRPLISEDGYAFLNSSSNYTVSSTAVTYNKVSGSNSRYNGEFAARYDVGRKFLKYVELGASYESSEFRDRNDIITRYRRLGAQTMASLGVDFADESLSDVGINSSISFPGSPATFFLQTLPSISADCNPSTGPVCPSGTRLFRVPVGDDRLAGEKTREENLSFWVQSRIDIGKLEIIGGLRLDQINIDAVTLRAPTVFDENFVSDEAFRQANTILVPEKARQRNVLPRILANYRVNENVVIRAGYYSSIARPQVLLLSQTPVVQLFLAPIQGPNANQPYLGIFKGNPDLKPASTHNFDFSAEYYDKNIGVVKIGAFYKRINNLLETNVATGSGALEDSLALLPDDPRFQDVVDNPRNYFVSVAIPENNDDPAHIWGIETSIEKQFAFLPGAFSGLGIYANYTYSDSSKNQPVSWNSPVLDQNGNVIDLETSTVVIKNVRFNGQAKHSGTIGLTYNKYGFDANLAYTMQARRQTIFQGRNLSQFEEAYGSLDARIEYKFKRGPGDFSIYFEGADLLRDSNDPSIRTSYGADDGTTPKYFDSARYFGGRQIRFGVRASF